MVIFLRLLATFTEGLQQRSNRRFIWRTGAVFVTVSSLRVDKSVGCVNVDIAHLQTVSTLMKGIIFVNSLVWTVQDISANIMTRY